MEHRSFIKYVESFNHNLKIITREIVKRCPADATIYRAQKRIMTVLALEPMFAIKQIGPYLYTYRDKLFNFNDDVESFFLENDFDTELKDSVNQGRVDMTAYIIPKAKDCIRSLPPDEKKEYYDLIVKLLEDYIEYKSVNPL